jgi:L-ascorbate metabolism protein UlaG (beta-lactamase superfamily)
MDPEEAVQAFLELNGSTGRVERGHVMVPIHWGTFKLTDESMDEPPRRTREAWATAGLDESLLWIPRHGETRDF